MLTNSTARNKRAKFLTAKLQLPDEYLGPSSLRGVENSFGKDTSGETKSPHFSLVSRNEGLRGSLDGIRAESAMILATATEIKNITQADVEG